MTGEQGPKERWGWGEIIVIVGVIAMMVAVVVATGFVTAGP